MANTKVEELTISIKVDDHNSASKIDEVAQAVRRLSNAANVSGMGKLSTVASNLKDLANASARLNTVSKNFNAVATSTASLLNVFQGFGSSAGVQAITAATDALTRFGDAASGVAANGNGLKAMSDGLQSMIGSLQALPGALSAFNKKGMGGMFSAGMDEYSKNVSKVIQNMSKGLNGVNTKAFDSISRFSRGLSALAKLSKDGDLGRNLKGLAQDVALFAQELSNAVPDSVLNRIERLGNAFANLRFGMRAGFGGAAGSAAKASGGLFKVGDLAKSVGSTFKSAYQWGMRLAKIPFSMMFVPLKGVGGLVKSIGSSFSGLLSRIGRVAFTRAIRAAIRAVTQAVREGVNNLYLWASAVGNTFKPTMDSLATSFLYLKNSVGAAVSPILDALAPAIDTAIDKFVEMLNTFNQVVANLTGATSWRKAVKSAASYADNISGLGHEAQGANDAVKELKRTLLGFDEINRLDDATKTTSPASKGKDATGYYAKQGALSFVEMPLSQPVKTFVDRLKDAWANADFTGIGNTIGEKIGGALLNVPWATKIQPTTKRLASSFGTLLNGMFGYSNSGGKAMWDGIAYTVYNSLNTALLGYVTFFTTVDWRDIGRGLGEALKRSLYGIDWGLVREALAAFPNAVIKAINGFNERFTINDFYEIGHKIGDSVAGAITDIEWGDLFKGATGLARRILNGINGALEGFGEHWGDIKDGITNGIKSVSQKTWDSLGEDIGKALFNIAYFGANLLDTAMKAIESIHWGRLIGSIWKGIDQKVQDVYGGWGGAAIALGKWIVGHLGVLSLLLTFSIGKLLIAGLTSSIAKYAIGTALASKLGGSAAGGLSCAGWLGGMLKLTALVALIFEIGKLFTNVKKQNWPEFAKRLGGGLVGALIGFAFGGPVGAMLGFSVGAELTVNFTKIVPKVVGGLDNLLFGWYDKLMGNDRSKYDHGINQNVLDAWAAPYSNTTNNNSTKKTNTKSSSSPLAIKIPAELALDNVEQQFSNLQTKWKQETSGKSAGNFKIDLLPEPEKWRSQRDTGWKNGVLTIPALPFQTAGVKDESPTWKQQAYSAWYNQTRRNYAEKFRTGGIVDEGDKWWNSAKRFWKTAIKGESLTATVTLGGSGGSLWNVFVGAWNKLQGYFNNNPLTAWIRKVTSPGKADGGVFQNGRWHDITRYAAGGMPSSGEMFIAREAGPEMVGTLNGSTAVVNNEQIVASIADGVYRATLAAMGSQGQNPMNDITVKLDSEVIYRAARRGEKIANNRYGTVVTVGG